jgi:hypothetical protein
MAVPLKSSQLASASQVIFGLYGFFVGKAT